MVNIFNWVAPLFLNQIWIMAPLSYKPHLNNGPSFPPFQMLETSLVRSKHLAKQSKNGLDLNKKVHQLCARLDKKHHCSALTWDNIHIPLKFKALSKMSFKQTWQTLLDPLVSKNKIKYFFSLFLKVKTALNNTNFKSEWFN